MNQVIQIEEVVKKQPYKVASRLISMWGDEAEEVVYTADLSLKSTELLLAGLKRRRVHLENLRGF